MNLHASYCMLKYRLQAREGYLQRHQLREEFDGTFTTVLGLHFDVSGHHFRPDGKMTLKCTSSMLSIYWQSREVRFSMVENVQMKMYKN